MMNQGTIASKLYQENNGGIGILSHTEHHGYPQRNQGTNNKTEHTVINVPISILTHNISPHG